MEALGWSHQTTARLARCAQMDRKHVFLDAQSWWLENDRRFNYFRLKFRIRILRGELISVWCVEPVMYTHVIFCLWWMYSSEMMAPEFKVTTRSYTHTHTLQMYTPETYSQTRTRKHTRKHSHSNTWVQGDYNVEEEEYVDHAIERQLRHTSQLFQTGMRFYTCRLD